MPETINITLTCSNFPGRAFADKADVFVGVQHNKDVIDAVPGDSEIATFTIPVRLKKGKDGQPDFLGACVHGKPGDRFIYLVWFEDKLPPNRFGRAKIKLNHLTWGQVKGDIRADLSMTDKRGRPIYATVKEDLITWQYSR